MIVCCMFAPLLQNYMLYIPVGRLAGLTTLSDIQCPTILGRIHATMANTQNATTTIPAKAPSMMHPKVNRAIPRAATMY